MRRSELIADYMAHAAPLVSAPLPVHAAVHRGEIVVGANGDVFGGTVNLAARMLGIAGPHDVVASDSAIFGLSAQFKAEPIGSRAFKNIEHEVPCFRLLLLCY